MPRKKIVKKKTVKSPVKKTKVTKAKSAPKKKKSVVSNTRKKVAKKPVKKVIKKKAAPKGRKKKVVKKVMTDDLELNIFGDKKDDLALELESVVLEKAKEEAEPNIFAQEEIKEAPTVSINIKRENNVRKVSQNVLNLKHRDANISKQEIENSFALEVESNPWDTFINIFSGNLDEYENGLLKTTRRLNKFLNLSIVAWVLYLSLAIYKVFYPTIKMIAGFFVFLAKAFWQYMKTMKHFISLLGYTLAGKAKLDSESLLYPEKAFLDVQIFEPQKREPFRLFTFNPVMVKSVAMFIIIAFVVVLPVKGMDLLDGLQGEKEKVLGVSETAYSSLQLALEDIQNFSWVEASEHFAASRDQFTRLESEFNESHTFIKRLLLFIPSVKDKLRTAENMVSIGIDVSLLGEKLTHLLHLLQESDNTVTLTQKISAINKSIAEINEIESRITTAFAGVSLKALPDNIRDEVNLLQNALPQLFASLNQIEDLMNFTYDVLGGDKQQRYLLIFQNSDELRPSGGFMGSLSVVDVYQGKIINSETPTGGPYDWQAWLNEESLAPQPLWIVNSTWQFQDANWFYDFPTSVEKILNFYHQTEDEVVDGVIAVNSYVLPDILRLTGDIEMPDYDKVLTPENVLLEIQKAVELEYDKDANEPKKIIGDLLDIMTERLLDLEPGQFVQLLEITNDSLMKRDIQMYFVDPDLQEKVSKWDWAGEAKKIDGDYLAVVNTNIAGAKTDKFILQDVDLESQVQEDGSIINTLTIKRLNDGIPGDVFYGHNNVNYLRVYVPMGSELIEAYGHFEPPKDEYFEVPAEGVKRDEFLQIIERDPEFDEKNGIRITDEFGKTAFAGWLQTNLAETSEITLRYYLPFKVTQISSDSSNQFIKEFDKAMKGVGLGVNGGDKLWHSIYWQKQSGQHNNKSTYTLTFSDSWNIDYMSRAGYSESGMIEYQTPLEYDFSSGFLFGIE